MKTNRLDLQYRESASKLHKKIGDILLWPGGLFATYKVYQEYPVNRININYNDASHKFDWVVLDLRLVIEAHGAQHFKPVDFGGQGKDKTIDNWHNMKYRDHKKEQAAIEAGYTYIIISYEDINAITDSYIWGMYQKNLNHLSLIKQDKSIDKYKEEIKEKAKQYRHEQYLKQKEIQKEIQKGIQKEMKKENFLCLKY